MNTKFYLFLFLALLPLTYALPTIPANSIYIDANVSSPIVLQPQDSSVYNIKLYTNNQTFNFTWTGTQYELYLLFSSEGDFPFVINSTDVTGELTGVFLVRIPYNITINLYNQKSNWIPFLSNRYKNDFAYILMDLTTGSNVYKEQNEKYTFPLNFKTTKTRFFHAPYLNGQAKIKLWEKNQYYNVRLIDGNLGWDGVYSIPNVSKTYGINAYLGNYRFNGTSTTYDIYISPNDLHPYRNLLNWTLIALVVFVIILTILFATEYPTASVIFGIFSTLTLIGIRIVLWLWWGS